MKDLKQYVCFTVVDNMDDELQLTGVSFWILVNH